MENNDVFLTGLNLDAAKRYKCIPLFRDFHRSCKRYIRVKI